MPNRAHMNKIRAKQAVALPVAKIDPQPLPRVLPEGARADPLGKNMDGNTELQLMIYSPDLLGKALMRSCIHSLRHRIKVRGNYHRTKWQVVPLEAQLARLEWTNTVLNDSDFGTPEVKSEFIELMRVAIRLASEGKVMYCASGLEVKNRATAKAFSNLIADDLNKFLNKLQGIGTILLNVGPGIYAGTQTHAFLRVMCGCAQHHKH
jgi:hypothetical protein